MISNSLVKDVSDFLQNYSTSLIKISKNSENGENATLIGTGTFVSLSGKKGILTAHHVKKELQLNDSIGLTLVKDVQYINIPLQHLTLLDIGIPNVESTGPDLSLITLPDQYYEKIKPYKSFFPLDTERKKILEYLKIDREDLWFVYGTIGERTEVENPQKGFNLVYGYHGFCGMTFIGHSFELDSFDYLDVIAEFEDLNDLKSYGGFSGGGLWRVLIHLDSQNEIIVKDILLSGVMFYEYIRNEERFLRSHGPKSIYHNLFEKFKN